MGPPVHRLHQSSLERSVPAVAGASSGSVGGLLTAAVPSALAGTMATQLGEINVRKYKMVLKVQKKKFLLF